MNKHDDILYTAQELFTQFGLKKVTMDEVARKANVSKATLYKYYPNKFEIFNEVVRNETEKMVNEINEAVDKRTTVESKLKTYLFTKLIKIHNLIELYKITEDSWGFHWPYIAEFHAPFMEHERCIVKNILEYGVKTGELDIKDSELSAHVFVISLKSVEYPWAFEGLDLSLPDIVDMMINTFLNGVRTRCTELTG